MSDLPNKFSGSSYLGLAVEAIRFARKPLTPMEMLDIARNNQFLPQHLFGATMHKTLSARLSENIRSDNDKSAFYRTAPSTFFLHELASSEETPVEFKKVYVGNLRSKNIRKENVLVASREKLSTIIHGSFVSYNESIFQKIYDDICSFVDRKSAEENDLIKQFVTFTLVYFDEKILIYRRGKFTTASDLLKGQLSVGFGGHVNDADFDLFNRGGDAFRANAARELREELFLDEVYHDQKAAMDRASILGYINVDDTSDAQHHIAVLIAFRHKDAEIPKKGELSINQLSWLDLSSPLNDLSDFDLWSGMILRNIFDGTIKLGNIHDYSKGKAAE